MNKKKKIAVIAASFSVLIVLLCAAVTIAFLTDQRTVTNKFSLGDVKIDVTETGWTKDEAKEIRPGGPSIAKDPIVENVGSLPCFVRVTITVSGQGQYDAQKIVDFVTVNNLDTANWTAVTSGDTLYDDGKLVLYYNRVLDKGQKTGPLFTSVNLNAKSRVDNSDLLETLYSGFEVDVIADAVQTGYDGTTYTTAAQAFAAMNP